MEITRSGKCVLCVKPGRCKPRMLAALFKVRELCIILVYEGFAVGWDRPVEHSLGYPQMNDARWQAEADKTYSSARSRAMSYLRRLIVAMIPLPSSSLAT